MSPMGLAGKNIKQPSLPPRGILILVYVSTYIKGSTKDQSLSHRPIHYAFI